MTSHFLFAIVILAGSFAAAAANKLTYSAAIVGGLLGTTIYAGTSWTGIALLAAFFIIGTVCTSYKKGIKQQLGVAQEGGKRVVGQVLANGGAAAVMGVLAIVFPSCGTIFLAGIAGAFSAATADTVSSELGSVYGRRFYDILSFSRGERGRDGVISVEGLLFGVMGSAIIAAVYAVCYGSIKDAIAIIVAGLVGNLADSYLGATLERKGYLGNDAVNLINTAIGAATAAILV